MKSNYPRTFIVGLGVSIAATVLWTAEQVAGLTFLVVFECAAKLVLVLLPIFFLKDLSEYLWRRIGLTALLGLVLIAATLGAMVLFLPFRDAYAERFGTSTYSWYYPGRFPPLHEDYDAWKQSWAAHIPHMTEAAIIISYYSLTLVLCAAVRLTRLTGALTAFAGYLLLLLAPIFTGLIVWDYDTFLMGVVLDSISFDLVPPTIWFAGDYSICLFVFMLIFYATTTLFVRLAPRVPQSL